MTVFKKGDRVKVVEKNHYIEGLVGTVRGVHPPSLTYYNVGVDFTENLPEYMVIDSVFETFNYSELVKVGEEPNLVCEICGTTTDKHTNELCFK